MISPGLKLVLVPHAVCEVSQVTDSVRGYRNITSNAVLEIGFGRVVVFVTFALNRCVSTHKTTFSDIHSPQNLLSHLT